MLCSEQISLHTSRHTQTVHKLMNPIAHTYRPVILLSTIFNYGKQFHTSCVCRENYYRFKYENFVAINLKKNVTTSNLILTLTDAVGAYALEELLMRGQRRVYLLSQNTGAFALVASTRAATASTTVPVNKLFELLRYVPKSYACL